MNGSNGGENNKNTIGGQVASLMPTQDARPTSVVGAGFDASKLGDAKKQKQQIARSPRKIKRMVLQRRMVSLKIPL